MEKAARERTFRDQVKEEMYEEDQVKATKERREIIRRGLRRQSE